MANLNGTNHDDTLLGTSGSDVINGRNGDDWIEGGAGNDTLTGGKGHDIFAMRDGFGSDHITDFNGDAGDRILFDVGGAWSDILYLGQLTDGLSFDNGYGTAHFDIHISDYNGDGKLDTRIDAYDLSGFQGSVIVDSHADLWGWALMGG